MLLMSDAKLGNVTRMWSIDYWWVETNGWTGGIIFICSNGCGIFRRKNMRICHNTKRTMNHNWCRLYFSLRFLTPSHVEHFDFDYFFLLSITFVTKKHWLFLLTTTWTQQKQPHSKKLISRRNPTHEILARIDQTYRHWLRRVG